MFRGNLWLSLLGNWVAFNVHTHTHIYIYLILYVFAIIVSVWKCINSAAAREYQLEYTKLQIAILYAQEVTKFIACLSTINWKTRKE